MLRITKAEEQALRLTMRLAGSGQQHTLGELAAMESLPEPTVAKLLGQLRRGGVVAAVRGRNGGYGLAAPAERISAADVLRALGGEPAPHHHCITTPESAADCPRLSDCGLRSVWRHLQGQVTRLLEGINLRDLLQAEQTVTEHMDRIWPLEPSPSFTVAVPPSVAVGSRNEGADI